MSVESLGYTQADLAEARALAPELGSKAQERIARALAERARLGSLAWARQGRITPNRLRALQDVVDTLTVELDAQWDQRAAGRHG